VRVHELGFQSLLRQLSQEAPTLTVEATPLATGAEVEQYVADAGRRAGWR
jgi:hypothetical protein